MWKKKFVKLMFDSDLTKTNIEKALYLKYTNIPSSLYKYKAFNTKNYSLRFLKEDKIKLSDPKNFNDPFDCSISFSKEKIDKESFIGFMKDPLSLHIRNHFFSDGEIQKIINSNNPRECFMVILEEKYPHLNPEKLNDSFDNSFDNNVNMHEYYNLLKGITHITCYSETKSSIPMWSHYADHHKGFCVEYNFKELVNQTLTNPIYPVIYNDKILDLSEYQGSDRSKKLNNLRFTYGAITKSPEWAYEKEWRYVVHEYPSDEPFFQITPKPKAIYLGAKFDESYRKDILDIAENREIKVYDMKMKTDEFRLEQHEISIN